MLKRKPKIPAHWTRDFPRQLIPFKHGPALDAWDLAVMRRLRREPGLNARQLATRFWPQQRDGGAAGRMTTRMLPLKTARLIFIRYRPEICYYLSAAGYDVLSVLGDE